MAKKMINRNFGRAHPSEAHRQFAFLKAVSQTRFVAHAAALVSVDRTTPLRLAPKYTRFCRGLGLCCRKQQPDAATLLPHPPLRMNDKLLIYVLRKFKKLPPAGFDTFHADIDRFILSDQ